MPLSIPFNKPFVAGKARLSAFGAQWFSTGPAQEVAIYDDPGVPGGVIYFSFSGLGANRKCVAWFDLRVRIRKCDLSDTSAPDRPCEPQFAPVDLGTADNDPLRYGVRFRNANASDAGSRSHSKAAK